MITSRGNPPLIRSCEFQTGRAAKLKNSTLVSQLPHLRWGDPAKDASLNAVLESGTKVVSVFGKSWDIHVTDILNATLEQNLEIIQSTIRYLTDKGKAVFYDAEHFFDGYKANPDYAIKTLKAAADSGAGALVLCDTNGSSFPFEIEDIVPKIVKLFPDIEIGILHTTMSVWLANAISAVRCGAAHVQGTFGGFGKDAAIWTFARQYLTCSLNSAIIAYRRKIWSF